MRFTEPQLEAAFIKLLGGQGYPHVRGAEIKREKGEVLLAGDLQAFLEIRYEAERITENEITSIIRRVESLPASD